MFTGLIEEIGSIRAVSSLGHARQYEIAAQEVLAETKSGDSLAVNGVCLTVTQCMAGSFTVQAVEETLRKTSLGNLHVGSRVNLERALRFDTRLGGHLVQGHVEGLARITALAPQTAGRLMTVELPRALLRYLIPQGAIALEGVSLTVAHLADPCVTVALIPHTLACTTLGQCQIGEVLNIETDLIARHVERLMHFSPARAVDAEKLKQWGY